MLPQEEEERTPSDTPPSDPPDTEEEDPQDGSGDGDEDGSGGDSDEDSGGEEELDETERLRREVEDLRRKNRQYVAAERNRARRTDEAAGAEAPPTATRSAVDEQRYREAERNAQDLEQQLRQIALEEKDPDPAIRRAAVTAKATLHLAASTQRQNMETMAELAILKMPPEFQGAVRKAWDSKEFATPQAALRAVKGDLYDKGGRTKPPPIERDDDNERTAARRRSGAFVGMSHRSVSAGEHKQRTQKTSDFAAEAARLQKAGDWAALKKLDDEETSGKRLVRD